MDVRPCIGNHSQFHSSRVEHGSEEDGSQRARGGRDPVGTLRREDGRRTMARLFKPSHDALDPQPGGQAERSDVDGAHPEKGPRYQGPELEIGTPHPGFQVCNGRTLARPGGQGLATGGVGRGGPPTRSSRGPRAGETSFRARETGGRRPRGPGVGSRKARRVNGRSFHACFLTCSVCIFF